MIWRAGMTCKKLNEINIGDSGWIVYRDYYVCEITNIMKKDLDDIKESEIKNVNPYFVDFFPHGLFIVRKKAGGWFALEGNIDIFDNKISALQNALARLKEYNAERYKIDNDICNDVYMLLLNKLSSSRMKRFHEIVKELSEIYP